MSKTEILDELPKLTKEERFEIRLKLAELDGDNWLDDDDPLSDEQKALLETRLKDMEMHPETSIPGQKPSDVLKTVLESTDSSALQTFQTNIFNSPNFMPRKNRFSDALAHIHQAAVSYS